LQAVNLKRYFNSNPPSNPVTGMLSTLHPRRTSTSSTMCKKQSGTTALLDIILQFLLFVPPLSIAMRLLNALSIVPAPFCTLPPNMSKATDAGEFGCSLI
ncbi:hypothetical protein JI435_082430, partial [Parastagonospora nodorum SN15]